MDEQTGGTGTEGGTWGEALALPLGVVGALMGAALGVWLFGVAARSGYYMPVLVEGASAFGAVALARRGGWGLAAVVALIALAGGLVGEYLWVRGGMRDPDLLVFLTTRREMFWVFHALGVGLAVAIVWGTPGRRRREK